MHILTQKGNKCLNLGRYDLLEVDGTEILAWKDGKYTIIGTYDDVKTANNEFERILEELEVVRIK